MDHERRENFSCYSRSFVTFVFQTSPNIMPVPKLRRTPTIQAICFEAELWYYCGKKNSVDTLAGEEDGTLMEVLGIDIGGSGIKGAVVNTTGGELLTEPRRLLTPQPSTPQAMAVTVAELVKHFNWQGPIGCGFPSVVKNGVIHTAANISEEWIGVDAAKTFREATSCEVVVINDADAAGLAEMRFGAGRGQSGTVLVVTLGTGIGTAIFVNDVLVPNLELGHIEVKGKEAESFATAAVRTKKKLSWKRWAKRVDKYLRAMERLIWPDLIIIGGGISKDHAKFFPLLTTRAKVLPAEMRNQAGIVGAALAFERYRPQQTAGSDGPTSQAA